MARDVQRVQTTGSPAEGVAFRIRNDVYSWEQPERLNRALASLLNHFGRHRYANYTRFRRSHTEIQCTLFLLSALSRTGKAGYFGLIDLDQEWSEFGWIKHEEDDAAA
ncbi:MAG: hypothetical protein KIT09_30440 [Bryobacteraceae bacterium]|nr:hypothetical protein [Bryobacteraceae bacterium]